MKKNIFILFTVFFLIFMFCPICAQSVSVDALLNGRLSLEIPPSGYNDYYYSIDVLSDDQSLSSDDFYIEVDYLPDGVSFFPQENKVRVYDYAKSGTLFLINLYASDESLSFKDKTYTVKLSENLLTNGNFADYPSMSGWDTKNSSAAVVKNSILNFNFSEDGSLTYILTQENKIAFSEDTLYELNFDIRTHPLPDNETETKTYSETIGRSAVIYLENPYYPDWTNVTIPIRINSSGEYIFSLVIASNDEPAHVSLKNLSLVKSQETPAFIEVSPPQAINIPKNESTTINLDIEVLDIERKSTPASIYYTIRPHTDSIKIEGNVMTIYKDVIPGEYLIEACAAKYPNVKTKFNITITDGGVTNGNFESKDSSESWFSPGDCVYEVHNEGNNHYASFTPNAEIGVLYNNAYVSFEGGQSYVFSADLKKRFSDAPAYITFIIEDSSNPDNLMLCAYFEVDTSWKNYKAVFTPEDNLSGRFIVAVNVPIGFDEQTIYMDNINVIPAIIKAENVKITGSALRGNTVKGTFKFTNNFDGESASITNWAISDYIDGPYTNLSLSNVKEIEITEAMEGKYLRFEVTPISLTAGLVGETSYSSPLKIQEKSINKDSYSENDDKPDPQPSKQLKDRPEFIKFAKLSLHNGKSFFSDTENHWAKNEIDSIYISGIAEGYVNNVFMPDNKITRAEFSTFIIRAIGLDPGVYSGMFTDVSPQSWYAGIVQTMYNCSFINGVNNELFLPNYPITREQAITILMRIFKYTNSDSFKSTPLSFPDAEKISSYAKPYIEKAFTLQLLKGNEEGLLNPTENLTRAETAVLISRFLEIVSKNN